MVTVGTGNAEHYRWGRGCDGWHLLAGDDRAFKQAPSVIEEPMPPGTAGQRHYHVRARQFFYVLEGEAVLELEGTSHRLPRGEGLHVSPGAAHQMLNDGAGDVRFLVVSAPRSHGDRIPSPVTKGAA